MSRWFKTDWLNPMRHPSQQELFLYVDEGLSAPGAQRIRKHLELCWLCRRDAEKMQRAISRFVDFRTASLVAPPQHWAGFEGRLRQAAAEQPEHTSPWRLPPRFRFPIQWVPLGVTVLLVLLWLHLSSLPTVSAKELLRRAGKAEVQDTQSIEQPVIYQKLEVMRRSAQGNRQEAATFELWNDLNHSRQHYSGTKHIWEEMSRVLEKNRFDPLRPLSPSAYEAWRSSIAMREEMVSETRLPDGSAAFAVETIVEGPHKVYAVMEARLVIRAKDWHPVSQNLTILGDDGVRQYGLTQIDFAVVPLQALDAAIFEEPSNTPSVEVPPTPRAPVTEALAELPLPVEVPALAPSLLERAELEARYALHNLGVCRGEPIQVVRDDNGRVVVRGLAGTEQRRHELLSALHEQPTASLVTVELRTVEEMVALEDVTLAEPSAPTTGEIHFRVDNGKLGVELLLGGNPSAAIKQVVGVSVRSVSSATALLSDAWAVRRLAERYGSALLEDMDADAVSLLGVMVRDHLQALESQARALSEILDPVRSLAGTGTKPAPSAPRVHRGSWGDDSRELFETVERTQLLVSRLFAQSGTTAQQARQEAAELFGLLENLQDQYASFSAPNPRRVAGLKK